MCFVSTLPPADPAWPGGSLLSRKGPRSGARRRPGVGDSLHANVDVEGFGNVHGLTRSSTITGLCLWVPALL